MLSKEGNLMTHTSNQIEVHILTDTKGNVVGTSTNGADGAVKEFVDMWTPNGLSQHFDWGHTYSHGYLREYWRAMQSAGYKITSRWIEL